MANQVPGSDIIEFNNWPYNKVADLIEEPVQFHMHASFDSLY
jgi:hypothetical protein